mgnify:FL=1
MAIAHGLWLLETLYISKLLLELGFCGIGENGAQSIASKMRLLTKLGIGSRRNELSQQLNRFDRSNGHRGRSSKPDSAVDR